MDETDYQNSLNNEYNELRELGVNTLKTIGITTPTYKVEEDHRHSLDLHFKLPPEAGIEIEEKILIPIRRLFEDDLKAHQFIFEPSWLHVSLVVILAAEVTPPLDVLKDPLDRYQEIIDECLSVVRPIDFHFDRVIPFPGNPGGIALGGFPDNSLQLLREKIKREIDHKGLRRFERRPSTIWHSTVARWETDVEPNKAQDVLDLLNTLDNQIIWRGMIDKVVYEIGGYNTSPKNSQVLQVFDLK